MSSSSALSGAPSLAQACLLGAGLAASSLCAPVLAADVAAATSSATLSSDTAPFIANQLARLDTVTITATRTPVRVDQTVADVTVLQADDLAAYNGRTLTEVLAQQPGIQFSSNGGLGKTSSLFLRGLEARHVLLLVDGVRYGSATTGMPELDNLPLGDIERIEIVRGPLASLYGSDAVGGVVQVFTRRPTPGQGLRGYGAVTVGSHRYSQAHAGLDVDDGPWSLALNVVHTENQGFSTTNERVAYGNYNADTDGFRQDAGSLHLGLKLPEGWKLGAHWVQSQATSAYDDGPGANALSGLRTQVLSMDLIGQPVKGWTSQLRVARSANDYETLAAASPYADLGTIATAQQQLSWDNTVALPVGSLLVVAEHLVQKVSKPAGNYDITQRTINSVALGYHATVQGHTVQASVRQDRNSQYGAQTTGNLGYGVALADSLRLTGQLGTSFVAPSFNQLYWPSYGNPLLEPERGRHAELGLRYTLGEHLFGVTVFANRVRGYITEGANPVNLPYANSNGVTLSYEGQLGPVRTNASIDRLDPTNDTTGSTNQGKQLPRRARSAGKFTADMDVGHGWSVGSAVQAYSHRFDDAANTIRLAGYATLDLHTQWTVTPEWTASARLNNVANRRYETSLGYNQPGRELYVGLRYSPR